MDPTLPQSLRQGQRTLAAIVFTDVVSFSVRMQAAEETTLRLLERDFAVMREVCARFEGTVLKTTGDGLLLYFTSAVQAVACALAMQRYFAWQSRQMIPAETLIHRIGIHLGDVFVSEQDVMGDGVNIASRLQAEAEPGGVCISQTVYDVVKNKLALQVTSLGPRELKNITQAVPVYRILLEAQALEASKPPFLPPPIPRHFRIPHIRWQHVLVTLAFVGVMVVFLALATVLSRRGQQPPPKVDVIEAVARAIASHPETELLDREFLNRRDLALQVRWSLEKYDFDGLARAIRSRSQEGVSGPGAAATLKALERMVAMKDWLAAVLRSYTRQQPLVVTDLSDVGSREFSVYVAPDRQMHFVGGGADRARSWADVKPAILGSIIISALRDARKLPSRDAALGVQAFARFYNLPQMQEVLRAGRQRQKQP